MKKTLIVFSVLILALPRLFAGGVSQGRAVFDLIRGPSSVALAALFEADLPIDLAVQSDASQVMARLMTGEAQMGILPPNIAARAAQAKPSLRLAAVTGFGMLSLLSNEAGLKRIEDMAGKTVSMAGQGATPEFVFRSILQDRGISAELNFSLGNTEIAPALIAGRINAAVLPEPFATQALNNPSVHRVGDLQAEWDALSGVGNYPMTVIVVNWDYFESRKVLLNTLLQACESSVARVTADPAAAALLVDRANIGITGAVAAASIPHSNFSYRSAADAKPSLEKLFSAFLQYAPTSIGGKLPEQYFYLP
jgi:NitT/TauT family transport system substrate-binding protein